ncbi:MAG: hypothetical protein KGJ89_05090 [Patescibacteria group bacterium]|nr:hypothetical protein [Patescibacteria group bacterium]MDE2227297.1 hypothetical protein [Patescibacteria group bacterium]
MATKPTDILKDPEFLKFSVSEKQQILQKVDPEFAALSQEEQGQVLSRIGDGAQQPQSVSKSDLTPTWARKHPILYSIAGAAKETLSPPIEALGLVGGGALGAATGNPLMAVAGAGLGYGGAKALTHTGDVLLGNVAPDTATQTITRTAENVKSGMMGEMGGQVLDVAGGAILDKLPSIARRLYENALKPVPSLPTSERENIITTGLDNAVKNLPYRPNEKSVFELGKNITNLVDTADNIVKTSAKADDTIPVKSLVDAMDNVAGSFKTGPFPKKDLLLIKSMKREFIDGKGFLPVDKVNELAELKQDFLLQGGGIETSATKKAWKEIEDNFIKDNKVLTATDALAMKKRIYKMAEKYYESGRTAMIPAKIEVEKAVAYTIKNELESLFPEAAVINKEAARQIEFGKVLERAANRTGNKEIFTMFDFLGGVTGAMTHGVPGLAEGIAVTKAARSAQAKAIFAKAISQAAIPGTVKKELLSQIARYGIAKATSKDEETIKKSNFLNALSKVSNGSNLNVQETLKPRLGNALRGNNQ